MSKAEEYAQWIVDNADKKGTPEFDTVAQAYQAAKSQTTQPESKTDKFLKPLQSMSFEDWQKNSIIAPAINYVVGASPFGTEEQYQEAKSNLTGKIGNAWEGIKSFAVNPVDTTKGVVNAIAENPAGAAGQVVKGALYDPQFLPKSVLSAAVKPITAPINIARDIKAARDVTKYGIGESAFAPVSREVVEAASNPELWAGKAPLSQRDAAKLLPHGAATGQVLREGKTVQGMAENWFNQPGWQKAITPAVEAGMLGLSAMGVPYIPGLGGYTAGRVAGGLFNSKLGMPTTALKAGGMATDLPKTHPMYGQQTFTYNGPLSKRIVPAAKSAAKDTAQIAAGATASAAAKDFDEDRKRRKEAYDVARRILSRGM
jgi:hypothetical protein